MIANFIAVDDHDGRSEGGASEHWNCAWNIRDTRETLRSNFVEKQQDEDLRAQICVVRISIVRMGHISTGEKKREIIYL